MAKNTQLSNAVANAQANALGALCNNGFIDIYDGAQPTNADTGIGAQVLLASLVFGATAFGSAAAGVITANAITADASANASGTAAWARIFQSDHSTVVMDVSVGTSNANIILNSVSISAGVAVSISSFTHTVAKATSGS